MTSVTQTRSYNAMIVEDSRLGRVELKSQLAQIPNISLVAEAENLVQARDALAQHQIDVIFLDINLPDGNGFDLLTELLPAPKVIFTTAFEQYALDAFDNNAVDYLLKPITQTRLAQACEKLTLSLALEETTPSKTAPMTMEERFFVKDGTQCWLIPLSNVERFEAMGNYTCVHFEGKHPMLNKTLAQIEKRLPDRHFFRVSRSYIVQLDKVATVQPCSSGALELSMESGAKVEVSRRQTSLFKGRFAL
ncbi:LytTR family DNA-binding domain-containing protein [Alteromonas sp. CI.11.F.A3]|uniref:LytR/AlgR family response regulator transcription factor n=1 Tax=Alteromonas sp. CI.11.F.A3 TaxID=3079555 RepID=UPI0029427917|nr:LytTR family DNA-binding domain-containing protein [Alteromonas sp. CI.11.F.A3]WOI38672.1 LytTR family DNA-binding domain-containing protein [Alteromonas sp. CI.11.F.A3]